MKAPGLEPPLAAALEEAPNGTASASGKRQQMRSPPRRASASGTRGPAAGHPHGRGCTGSPTCTPQRPGPCLGSSLDNQGRRWRLPPGSRGSPRCSPPARSTHLPGQLASQEGFGRRAGACQKSREIPSISRTQVQAIRSPSPAQPTPGSCPCAAHPARWRRTPTSAPQSSSCGGAPPCTQTPSGAWPPP